VSEPQTGNGVATQELRAALEQALSERYGTARTVRRLVRSPCVYRSSFALEELEVELDGGDELRVMWKDIGFAGLSERARAAKPEFLYDPEREIEVYSTILSSGVPGTASFYGASIDRDAQRYWLFIENVPGVALWQIGDLETWNAVARWAAALHARFAGRRPDTGRLLRYDADFFRIWMRRAQGFAERWEARRPGVGRKGIDWIASRYDSVVERLVALPVTFIHGELYASNVLVGDDRAQSRICPIDWEIAAVGPGVIDLAALSMGKWGPAERSEMAAAYRDALGDESQQGFAGEVEEVLDYARLHLAVQWLGWAPDWKPPRAQRQDWLGDALALAEALGL
jgi:Ser/Thr protein kinase RdoA (MazF antagonist)